MNKKGCGCAPGACGELVQGQLEDGEDFLVSLPVDVWAKVGVEITAGSTEVSISPYTKTKTRLAVRMLLDHVGYAAFGAQVNVESDIPEGKGLASSTADIVAACYAVGDALEVEITPALISKIARQIEPSDGIMYPGLVAYNHRKCELIQELGEVPPVGLLVVDLGGVVDTLDYNRNPKSYSQTERELCQEAYAQLQRGISQQDWGFIGRAATLSGRVNQRFLYKAELEEIIAIANQYRAHGVCVAHSGTVVGILFDLDSATVMQARDALFTNLNKHFEIVETRTRCSHEYQIIPEVIYNA